MEEATQGEPGKAPADPNNPRGSQPSERLDCPVCGSNRTQPFLHAGPGARINMKCLTCGHLFKDPHLRR
ncbi:MAG TPA: hypothetical protein VEM93_05580 [Actinomycetota bacterium]|nr:hypothetical protein [Actinomycetota bacterium]